jgi:NAD(P)H-flavin reductase
MSAPQPDLEAGKLEFDTDAKKNVYVKHKLIAKEWLKPKHGEKDFPVVRLTYGLGPEESLSNLGFDLGLGDFVRVKIPGAGGGKAYSPTTFSQKKGSFDLTIRVYPSNPSNQLPATSEYLSKMDIGQEVFIMRNVEHTYWSERQASYHSKERNIGDCQTVNVGLISFGIGITEVAQVALSELLDTERVNKVVILWASRFEQDVECFYPRCKSKVADAARPFGKKNINGNTVRKQDVVEYFLSRASNGAFGDRLKIVHILSQDADKEECVGESCMHGRIDDDVLKQVFQGFLSDRDQKNIDARFLAVGTAAMMEQAYERLARLGFDTKSDETGKNRLLLKATSKKLASDRIPSPSVAIGRSGPILKQYFLHAFVGLLLYSVIINARGALG